MTVPPAVTNPNKSERAFIYFAKNFRLSSQITDSNEKPLKVSQL